MREVTADVTFRMEFEHRCAKVLCVQDEDIAIGYWADFVGRRGTRAERHAAETSIGTATPTVDDRVFSESIDPSIARRLDRFQPSPESP